jgi:DNA-binding XRE family transcriptional regulator
MRNARMSDFKAYIKSLREGQYLSLADVAKKAGINRGTVWRNEMDPDYLCSGKTCQRMLAAMGYGPQSKEWQTATKLWGELRMGMGHGNAGYGKDEKPEPVSAQKLESMVESAVERVLARLLPELLGKGKKRKK